MATARKRSRAAIKPADTSFLKSLQKEANETYGAGTMVPAKMAYSFMKHIPFGHLIGDLCTLGGLLEGQGSMFLGRPGGGKTTQAMRCVAQAQKKYPHHKVLWVDTEQTFDPHWAEQHGVDMDRLILAQTATGEDAVDLIATAIAGAEDLCMVVLDSVNQTVPMKLALDSAGDANVALLARLMGILCSKLTVALAERRKKGWIPCTQIFVNQWREIIGGFGKFDTRKIPGGNQLSYYCSSWIEFKALIEMGKGETDGHRPYLVNHTFNMKRGKSASSLRVGEYSVVVGGDHHLPIGSYDESSTIMSQAKKFGIWEGGGTKQNFVGYSETFRKMADGIDWLDDNPEQALEIKRAILIMARQRVGLSPIPFDGYLLRAS